MFNVLAYFSLWSRKLGVWGSSADGFFYYYFLVLMSFFLSLRAPILGSPHEFLYLQKNAVSLPKLLSVAATEFSFRIFFSESSESKRYQISPTDIAFYISSL